MFAADALTQWQALIRRAFTYTKAHAMIIPAIEYDGRDAERSDGDGYFRPPMFIDSEWLEDPRDMRFSCCFPTPQREGFDIALATHVTLLRLDESPRYRRLDCFDVEPGHVFHPSDPLLKRYVALRTNNSYHLYPKRDPFGDGGGACVRDTKWKKGFLRITDRKGAIHAVNATPEPLPSSEIEF